MNAATNSDPQLSNSALGIQSRGKMMNSRLLKTVLIAACALAPLAAVPAGPAQAQSVIRPSQDIVLSIGRGQLITVPGAMTDIFVANDAIADVQVKSQRQLYVFGKAGGETTVYASNGAGDVIWAANIRVGSNIDSVDQMLRLAMPEANIQIATMGANTVLLTGTVAAPEDAAEAERLVQAFVGEDANVISRLKMATPLQVNLRVRIAEVSRSLVREIGANLLTRDTTGGFLFGVSRGRAIGSIADIDVSNLPKLDASSLYGLPAGSLQLPFNPATGQFVIQPGTQFNFTPPTNGRTALQLAGKLFGIDVMSALDLAERNGLVTTLSEPNLTALSGETAEFLAGGEFPIPLSQGLGTTTIEYKKYGVSLAYTPTVLANGRISIRVRPEVSELSTQGAVQLDNVTIPALTVRRAETTVELGSGESFMIAGLLSNNSQNIVDKTPGAGDVPILGNLFKSTDFRRGETELVIVVTPYLVNPVNDSEIRLPTDGYASATTLEQLLLNKEHDGESGVPRPMPRPAEPAPAPQVGLAPPAPGHERAQQAEAAVAPGLSLR